MQNADTTRKAVDGTTLKEDNSLALAVLGTGRFLFTHQSISANEVQNLHLGSGLNHYQSRQLPPTDLWTNQGSTLLMSFKRAQVHKDSSTTLYL